MTILSRPSRSYKTVQHDAEGLSSVGSAPYASYQRERDRDEAHTFKTYRPSYAEMHFKRQAMHDPNPTSAFSPLPPAFNLNRNKVKKEKALAGQRAEADHILEPGYRNRGAGEDDTQSVAGPSRLSSVRTAGGLSALSRKSKDKELDPQRQSASVASFNDSRAGGSGAAGNSARRGAGLGGVYMDSSGKLHDTEFDPFAGVSAISRRKSRRRSAFGSHRKHSSGSSSSEAGSSDSGVGRPDGRANGRTSWDLRREDVDDAEREKEEREIRRRLEVERRRLDEVSGYAAARRRSMMSDRASGFMNGRSTPSIRSGRDYTHAADDAISERTHMTLAEKLGYPQRTASRLSRHHLPSPRSDPYGDEEEEDEEEGDEPRQATQSSSAARQSMAGSFQSARTDLSPTTTSRTRRSSAGLGDESPRKHTETTPTPEVSDGRDEESPPAYIAKPTHYEDVQGKPLPPPPQKTPSPQPEARPAERPQESFGSGSFASGSQQTYTSAQQTLAPPAEILSPPLSPARTSDRRGGQPDTFKVPPLPRASSKARVPTIEVPKQHVEKSASGVTRVTGFDAVPRTPSVKPPASVSIIASHMKVPESARSGASSKSSDGGRISSEYARSGAATPSQRPKPAERPREQLFPETPAQAKRREERERRNVRSGKTVVGTMAGDAMRGVNAPARTRVLPEIDIVDDDDPRIIFPPNGASTRIQSYATGTGGRMALPSPFPRASISTYGTANEYPPFSPTHGINSGPTSDRSSRSVAYDSNRATSAIIEETGGGYVPSRWAGGDRHLRTTEEEKDRYRPKEWGGKKGDLAGRGEQWHPDVKDSIKRNVKDISTNARFGMFRAKQKLLRKADNF